MYLWEGVLRVRQALNELKPWLWSDEEVVDVLNESAQRMCSAAQFLQGFATFKTVNGMQEYILPADVDQVTGLAYSNGVVFPVQIVPRESLQLGGFVGGIMWYAYLKKQTRILAPMNSNAKIVAQPMNPNDGTQGESRTVIGYYPIPNGVYDTYVWYDSYHPKMVNPEDICQIPERFRQGWVSWAIARMKEKESAFDEMAMFDSQHDKYTQEFIDWQMTNGNEVSPPTYSNRPIPPYFLRGANTILVVSQNPGTTNM